MHTNMNHAATSGTKPPKVLQVAREYLEKESASAGRGSDVAEMQLMHESRKAIARFFGADSTERVVFTSGATASLNMAIFGLLRDGDHVLTTSLEHSATARPLFSLEKAGRIKVTWLKCDRDGGFDPECVEKAIRRDTRMLVMTHASNVLGNFLPLKESFAIAKKHGIFTVSDAAQSVGHIQVSMDENTDAIAFPGHKGLRALAGVGGLILSEAAAKAIVPWKIGGTGSYSQSLEMPDFMPDKLEAGTQNMLGIVTLKAAVEAIEETGLAAIREREKALTERLTNGLLNLPVTIYGTLDSVVKAPVISINAKNFDPGILANILEEKHGISTRSGLHCAPLAHQSIETYPHGTLRLSMGVDTRDDEVDYVISSLGKIVK